MTRKIRVNKTVLVAVVVVSLIVASCLTLSYTLLEKNKVLREDIVGLNQTIVNYQLNERGLQSAQKTLANRIKSLEQNSFGSNFSNFTIVDENGTRIEEGQLKVMTTILWFEGEARFDKEFATFSYLITAPDYGSEILLGGQPEYNVTLKKIPPVDAEPVQLSRFFDKYLSMTHQDNQTHYAWRYGSASTDENNHAVFHDVNIHNLTKYAYSFHADNVTIDLENTTALLQGIYIIFPPTPYLQEVIFEIPYVWLKEIDSDR